MRITESKLRRIIRGEILREAAMTPMEARYGDIRFEMSIQRDSVKISALKTDEEDIEVGYIAPRELQGLGDRLIQRPPPRSGSAAL